MNVFIYIFFFYLLIQTFTITVKDDDIPEVDEIFNIKLLTVSSGDGSEGSTNTSGASIDQTKARSVVTVLKNDHSNGVLQFTNRTTPPTTGEGILPVATVAPIVSHFNESDSIFIHNLKKFGPFVYLYVCGHLLVVIEIHICIKLQTSIIVYKY